MDSVKAQGRVLPTAGLQTAVSRVGDRWSLLVVSALLDGPRRWRDLAEALPRIAPNVLADRLRRLEREGIVSTSPYSERPPRLSYDLTADGRGLRGVLSLLSAWAERGATGPPHAVCGTPTEVKWHCPTCGTAADDAADDLTVV
jgi:DNA-binding HxlR family transcriptional regulator